MMLSGYELHGCEAEQAALLQRLLHLAIVHAGAQRGVLLQEQAGSFSIAAEGVAGHNGVRGAAPPAPDTPHAIPTYAPTVAADLRQTGETLVVEDTTLDHRFASDATIVQRGVRSLLCIPLLHQAHLVGILSLEHHQSAAVFALQRTEMLELLAAQAAIALEHARLYRAMQQEVGERERVEQVLLSITEGTATVTGGDFFRSLVRYLATTFGVRYAFAAECTDVSLTRVRTIAFTQSNEFQENIEYDVAGTPCEHVLGGEVGYYPQRVGELFPMEEALGVESYLGMPLCDSLGNILGHMAVMDDKPMQRHAYDLTIFKIFAARAGIELERKRAEEALQRSEAELRRLNERLEEYNRHLEQKVIERTSEIERRRQVAERLRGMLTILNSNRSLCDMLDYIVSEGIWLLGTQSGAIYRLEADQTMFAVQAMRGFPDWYTRNLTFPLRGSFAGSAVLTRKPVVVTDLADTVRHADIGLKREQVEFLVANYQTLLAVPLIRQGESHTNQTVYGCIAFYYPEMREFSREDIALAVAFADQAALAIENAHLRDQVEQSAVMEERGRLARELHDSVTQSLYSLTLLAEGWKRLAASGRLEDVTAPLAELGSIGQQALKEMRLLVHQLRPPVLEKEGLLGALHQRLAAVERRAGVDARLLAGDLVELPGAVEDGLYRIAHEALNNALKHASATSVTVRIEADAHQVEMEVRDNGQGFDMAAAGEQGGIGLSSMRERAEHLGGTCTIASVPGQGTQVRVWVRMREQPGQER
jgi:signal transduction histidine kinase